MDAKVSITASQLNQGVYASVHAIATLARLVDEEQFSVH